MGVLGGYIAYLEKIDRGEITVRVEQDKAKGLIWHVTHGMTALRLHEELGMVEPLVTAKWAGFPEVMYTEGVKPRLTEAGRKLIISG
jgi:hypothetical protein